ncbi:MAG: hypothetical protein KAG45_05975 [Methyloprofundus sp.]|nr:hypothetical protein [Methyloprofundus sp.]
MNTIIIFTTLALLTVTVSATKNKSSLNSKSFKSKVSHTEKEPETIKIRARITYYSVGQDKYGSRNADPSSKRSKIGVTVAAHPKFKFGTKLSIPGLKGIVGDGNFVVQDRGGAVTRKVASKGKHYVFDVFVTPSQRRKYMYKLPMYMDVEVLKHPQKKS